MTSYMLVFITTMFINGVTLPVENIVSGPHTLRACEMLIEASAAYKGQLICKEII